MAAPASRVLTTWLVAFLFVLPLIVYWPTIIHRFGFRDDYSILREAREEPGKIFQVCSMQARPLYGWLLEPTFRFARGIDDLLWIRAGSAVMLGLVAVGFYLLLRSLRWDRWIAALLAALLVVIPSSQVVVAWAVAWPLSASLLAALGAFACAEWAFRLADAPCARWRVALGWSAALVLVTASALIYQPNTVFYLTGVAAALWSRRLAGIRKGFESLVRHGVTLGIGLIAAFTVMMVAFANEWIPPSRRVALEQDWVAKFEWFVREPLQNALALIVLNDDRGAPSVHWTAALVVVLIISGLARLVRSRGWKQAAGWMLALVVLVVGSFSVNLVVSDRWAAYRVLLPLTSTLSILLTIALLLLGGRTLARFGLLALVLPGMWLARDQSFDLLAWPQSVELNLLQAGATRIDPAAHPRVFVLTPYVQEHVTKELFHDEFGSLSTDSYWAPKEMLGLIMRERYPAIAEVTQCYEFACGPVLPKGGRYDVVIDLHRLREWRPKS